jgi:hypothetical protein
MLYTAVPIGFSLAGMRGALVGVLMAQFAAVPFLLKVQHARGLIDWRFELGVLAIVPLGWGAGWLVS